MAQVAVSYINFSDYPQVLGVEMSKKYNRNILLCQLFVIEFLK